MVVETLDMCKDSTAAPDQFQTPLGRIRDSTGTLKKQFLTFASDLTENRSISKTDRLEKEHKIGYTKSNPINLGIDEIISVHLGGG